MAAFYIPVKVHEEENAVLKHGAELCALGRKALIVTGRRSASQCGALADVLEALAAGGTAHVVFDRVEENPGTETIMEARDMGLKEQADFVIGIGGGSPLDAAKAVALMMRHADRDSSYLYHPDGDSEALPVAAVPTTCGTGSEVTGVSVLTDAAKGIKKSIPHKLYPRLALIDGKYLKSAPWSVLANTAFDALTHLYESWLSAKATPYSRMCASAGLCTWAASLPLLRSKIRPDAAQAMTMMRASAMAGMSIALTGTALPHALSYPLTMKLGVPHGKACAFFMAGFLSEAPAEERDHLLRCAGFTSLKDFEEVYANACGPVEADPAALRDVLESAARTVAADPAKLASASFPADAPMLLRIAAFGHI